MNVLNVGLKNKYSAYACNALKVACSKCCNQKTINRWLIVIHSHSSSHRGWLYADQ